jgi:hypothetical protein
MPSSVARSGRDAFFGGIMPVRFRTTVSRHNVFLEVSQVFAVEFKVLVFTRWFWQVTHAASAWPAPPLGKAAL